MKRRIHKILLKRWPWWPALFSFYFLEWASLAHSQVLPYQPSQVQLPDQDGKFFARHELFMGSNFISLKELNNISKERFNTDSGGFAPKPSDNLALIKSHLEIGMIRGRSSYSFVHRLDAYSNISEGMARLAHANKMGQRLSAGTVLDLKAQVQGHEFIGLKWGRDLYRYQDETHRISFSGWLSALYGLKFSHFNGTGRLSSTFYNYFYDANISQYSSSRTYPYISEEKTQGLGLSSGLNISYENRDLGKLTLVLNDLYSQVNWQNLPYSEAVLIFNRAKFSAQGYLIFDPALLGQNDLNRRGFKEKLPMQSTIIYSKNIHRLGLMVGWQEDRRLQIPFAGISWKLADQTGFSYQHDFQFNGHQVGWHNDRWHMKVSWSQLPLSQTKMLATQLQYVRPW